MAVVASATGAAVFGLSGVAAGVAGGALLGAGAGALYSGITGDGNILNSALTGAFLGGGAGGIGAALAPAAAGTGAATAGAAGLKASTPAVAGLAGPTGGVASMNPAITTAAGKGLTGYTASALPSLSTGTTAGTALTGNQMLGYGLAGSAALSMLGSQGQPKLSSTTGTTPGQIRPYTYSQTRNPNFGQPGEAYFTQSYDAQPPYNAANGGLMSIPNTVRGYAEGGMPAIPNPRVDVQQLAAPVNTYTQPQQQPAQAVTDYNQLLAARANEESVKSLPPANMMPGGKYGTADLKNQITQKYQDILGRAPDQPGLDYWLQQAQGGTKLGDIRNSFLGSQEYLAANPGAVAPTPTVTQAPVGGPPQADIDAYLAANPSVSRRYDPKTQTYLAPTVTQAQIDAWKASQSSGGFLDGMASDPNFQNFLQQQYANYQQNQFAGGKAGGLMPRNLKYAAGGGVSDLGGFSDGGRLLKGPGDGVSDDIPAVIGDRQPARLADGEFVIPARIVSELGNGSTDAGAKRLYAMMDNIQAGRKKTIGKKNVAKDTKAKKHLLA